MINISDKPLSTDEERLLTHGPNYAIVLKDPPIVQYVASIEHACTKLEEGKADEFRVQVKVAIQKIQNPKPNITRGERIAIAELKKDPSRMVLTADKGVALIVMNTEDCKKKAEELLNQNTYRTITSDPTMKLKNKMISMLKSIKAKGGMSEDLYKRLYPTGAGSPKFYGLPKIHKLGMPLRPIVSSIGTVTYQTSKEVARILKPLVGRSPHHVKNTQDFIDQIKGIHLGQDQCMMSYDVKALFTSVPTTKAIAIIKQLLEQDQELQQRTSLAIENILSLLEFCITSTCFSFQGKYYEQLDGAAMGSPLSPIVGNLYMESFEVEAIRSAPHPPYLWKRFVDDTFTILQSSQRWFPGTPDSVDQHIQFTAEDWRRDGAMPFLDILVTPVRDGSLSTSVYRKPTHTDLHLQWDSHHTLTSKYSVIGTLQHRAQTICSNPQLLQKEEQHLKNALMNCKYPTWALNRIQMKTKKQDSKQVTANRTSTNNQKKSYIVVPYYSGLSESIKNIGGKFGVQVYFKGGTTIKNLLMTPKDKDPIQKQSGVIYRYQCDRVNCDEVYIEESSRTFGERFKEHLKRPSPIYDHSNITGHNVTLNNFNIVGREDLNQMRTIKEALYIRVNDPSLNRNVGKYNLLHVWEVLFNTSELKLK